MTRNRLASLLRWATFVSAYICLLAVGVVALAACQAMITPSSPVPTSSRQLMSSDLGWHEAWRRSLSVFPGEEPMATIVGDMLIIPVSHEGVTEVDALSIENGQTKWTKELVLPYGTLDSILADEAQVYVAMSPQVKSLRASDGQVLWTTDGLRAHTGYRILPIAANMIRLESGFFRDGIVAYDIDKINGEIKSQTIEELMLNLATDLTNYYTDRNFNLLSIDNTTNQKRWSVNARGPLAGISLINSKVLFFSAGSYLRSLTGVDPINGEILWKTPQEDIASNSVVISNTIYSIRTDAAITAVNSLTGREIGRMTFSGEPLNTDHPGQFWLIAGSGRLFAYFGDSKELVALEHDYSGSDKLLNR
jgi:outer membrane protein assembly factor BamB